MPTFRVLSRVDAFIDYESVVEAESADEAAALAYKKGAELKWRKIGEEEFQARRVVALDSDGVEIEETARGDF